jgi:hypothetical protein
MENLNPGAIVVYHAPDPSAWGAQGPGNIALFRYMLSKDFRVIMWARGPPSLIGIERLISVVNPEGMGKVYGEDYVNFGFIPGVEMAIASMAKDLPGTLVSDFYGTPVSQIPLMEGIKDATDVDLLIGPDGGGWGFYERHWAQAYGTTYISLPAAGVETIIMPFYHSGLIKGYFSGIRGGAELEFLSKHPGEAVIALDVLSISQLTLIFFVIVGNIEHFFFRSKGGK